jgi:hypothetical protein
MPGLSSQRQIATRPTIAVTLYMLGQGYATPQARPSEGPRSLRQGTRGKVDGVAACNGIPCVILDLEWEHPVKRSPVLTPGEIFDQAMCHRHVRRSTAHIVSAGGQQEKSLQLNAGRSSTLRQRWLGLVQDEQQGRFRDSVAGHVGLAASSEPRTKAAHFDLGTASSISSAEIM